MKLELSNTDKTLITLVAENADDVYNLGVISQRITGAKQGFTIESKTSLGFHINYLVEYLIKNHLADCDC